MKGDICEYDMECCGVKEISGISNYDSAREALLDILCEEDSYDYETGRYENDLCLPETNLLVFTQALSGKAASRPGYGDRLATYINRFKLGTVMKSYPARNPNTNNLVTVFIWTLDKQGIQNWAARQREIVKG